MKYCRFCGKELGENDFFCAACGKSINEEKSHSGEGFYSQAHQPNWQQPPYQQPPYQQPPYQQPYYQQNDDDGNLGWGLLGFFVPIVGLILYLIWKQEKPKNAKAAGTGALISAGIGVAIVLFYVFIFMVFVAGL